MADKTNAELQTEIDDLKARLDAKPVSWGDNFKSVVDYVANNKVKLMNTALALSAIYVGVHNYIYKTDHAAVQAIVQPAAQQAAHDEVKAKLPAAVDKAVDARPLPPPRQIPVSPKEQ